MTTIELNQSELAEMAGGSWQKAPGRRSARSPAAAGLAHRGRIIATDAQPQRAV
jgi:hypothetical protein